MVEVSDKFKRLATAYGRHVYCRIEAGGEVFYDDRLLEFDFDDVIHPDWVTFGTTCANRFHFRALYDGELAVNAEVKPYISFDNEEWCPLGVFYISRRYVRDGAISITAYDRMYSLDMQYSYVGTLPTTTDELLRGICAAHGITAEGYGYPFKVEYVPAVCTVRDMIGFIAGVNFDCAKFDRLGRLTISHRGSDNIYTIDKKNCMEIHRNMAYSTFTCVKVETDSGTLVNGDGAEISTMEMYNPLYTESMMTGLLSFAKIRRFYGAEIEMQGLPFLETGDHITVLDKGLIFPIHLSEVEYHYDGALTATVYSKNRTYLDNVVYMDDLEELLKSLSLSHNVVSLVQQNEHQLAIGADGTVIADFTFTTAKEAFAELNLSISLSQNNADGFKFSIYVNGAEAKRHIIHSADGTGAVLTHLYHLAQSLPTGENRIFVTAATKNGSAYILPDALHAGLVVHGGASLGGDADRLSLYDNLNGGIALMPLTVDFGTISAELTAERT